MEMTTRTSFKTTGVTAQDEKINAHEKEISLQSSCDWDSISYLHNLGLLDGSLGYIQIQLKPACPAKDTVLFSTGYLTFPRSNQVWKAADLSCARVTKEESGMF